MAITGPIAAAGIGAAGSIIGGGEQSSAANNAAKTQMKMYQQTRADLAPYAQGGTSAFSQLQNLMGLNGPNASASMLQNLQNYPGYQFAVQQGQQGLDRTAASRGLLLSGGQLKDTLNYNQGMADQLFGTEYSQLSGIANTGENAAAQTGTFGSNAAAGVAQSQLAGGTAAASGIAGASNQIGSLLNNANLQSQIGSAFGGGGGYSPDYIPVTPDVFGGY